VRDAGNQLTAISLQRWGDPNVTLSYDADGQRTAHRRHRDQQLGLTTPSLVSYQTAVGSRSSTS
jgi:YD repeat-containing protein